MALQFEPNHDLVAGDGQLEVDLETHIDLENHTDLESDTDLETAAKPRHLSLVIDLREIEGQTQDELVLDLNATPPTAYWRGREAALIDSPVPERDKIVVRALDIAGGLFGLMVSAPLMAVIWSAVKVTSPGPAVFRSPRAAQDGGVFYAYKFRTMVVDADQQLQEILDRDPLAAEEYRRTHKLANDPRVTRLGRFLRRASLDELPQFLNVLRGDMSLVGPRPNLLSEPRLYGVSLPTVRRVKPGLTGLWQVSGRSQLAFEERVFLDIEYATTRTLVGDLKLVARTAAQMFSTKEHGAM